MNNGRWVHRFDQQACTKTNPLTRAPSASRPKTDRHAKQADETNATEINRKLPTRFNVFFTGFIETCIFTGGLWRHKYSRVFNTMDFQYMDFYVVFQ